MEKFAEKAFEILDVVKEKIPFDVEKLKNPPMWVKITLGTTVVGYAYIRYKWIAMNDMGIPILSPSLLTLGSCGHYTTDDGFIDLTNKEMKGKGQKTIGYYRLLDPVVLTVDHELISSVFQTHFGSFPSRNPDIGSAGLGHEMKHTLDIIYDSKKWRRIRQTISPSFSTKQLEQMLHITSKRLDSLVEQINDINGKAINGKTVTGKYSLDGFMASSLGMDLNADLTGIESFSDHPSVKHFESLMNPGAAIILTFLIPGTGAIFDFFRTPITCGPAVRWFVNYCKSLAGADTTDTKQRNFLKVFNESKISDKDARDATKGMTEDEIISQIFILLVAGYETTSTLLLWCFYQVAKNRNLQQQLFDEVSNLPEEYESLNSKKAPLVSALINETLRFYPPVGLHVRYCQHDVNINGMWFTKGSNVEVPVDYLHRMEEYWGTDAHEFKPQRWIDQPDLEKAAFFMPFGAGPRNCVGMRFALMQAKMAVLRIINNFDITLVDNNEEIDFIRLPTTLSAPRKKVMFSFKPRQ